MTRIDKNGDLHSAKSRREDGVMDPDHYEFLELSREGSKSRGGKGKMAPSGCETKVGRVKGRRFSRGTGGRRGKVAEGTVVTLICQQKSAGAGS